MIRNEADGCYLVKGIVEREDPETDFALRMVTENVIRHLLRPRIRTFNGEKKLYYEIGGKQSLEAVSKVRALTGEDLSNLFGSLYALLSDLPGFFLSGKGVILSSEQIFTDGESYFFLYDLETAGGRDETERSDKAEAFGETGPATLARELLEMIDHKDEDAVVYAYQFNRAVREGGADLKQILEKVMVNEASEDETDLFEKDQPRPDESSDIKNRSKWNENEEENFEEDPVEKEAGERKRPDPFLLIVALLLCFTGAGLLFWRLTQTEPFDAGVILLSREGIGGIVFLLTGLSGLCFLLRKNTGLTLQK